jgi:nickel/cobalt transporter (NicO) family protein
VLSWLHRRRGPWLLAVAASAVAGVLLLQARPAAAHPLGNFSVNEYHGLVFAPDRVEVSVVIDTAEIPTRQDRSTVDTEHDGQIGDAELAGYAPFACGQVADAFEVRVDGNRLAWTVTPGGYRYGPGNDALPVARLTCTLRAPARLAAPATVTVANHYRADRVGWHEITAAGVGVHLVDSPLPDHTVSDELRAYPAGRTLDVRSVSLRVAPGAATGSTDAPGARGPVGDPLSRAAATAQRWLAHLAAGRLDPLVVALALLLAALLGAGHAALPGHGKTVLAAYLAGRAGRPRDALAVGATVTLTHTGAVLVMGLLLSTFTTLAGDRVLG